MSICTCDHPDNHHAWEKQMREKGKPEPPKKRGRCGHRGCKCRGFVDRDAKPERQTLHPGLQRFKEER